MSRSTRLALGALGVVIAAAIAGLIAFYPPSTTYPLWRYRRDPDSVTMSMPPLCAHGRSDLPYIYAAFDKYGKDADVGKFRAAIAEDPRRDAHVHERARLPTSRTSARRSSPRRASHS